MLKYIKKNIMELNYKIEGKGKKIILLHGWSKNAGLDSFDKLTKELLKHNFQVIRIDLPGFGKSPSPKSNWDIKNYAKETTRLLKKLKIKNNDYILLGHSFGGSVSAFIVANLNPKPKLLFLISSAGIRDKSLKIRLIYIMSRIIKIPLNLLPTKISFFIKKLIYFYILKERDYIESQENGQKEQYLKIINQDLSSIFKKIQIKTILIYGKNDTYTPIKHAQRINKLIKDSELKVIKKAKHGIIKTHTTELVKIIKNFSKKYA